MMLLRVAFFAQIVTLTILTSNEHHQPVPSATVYVQAAGNKESLTAKSDAKGVARFNVPTGDYTVRAENSGESASAPVTLNGAKKVELTLQPQFLDEPSFTVAGITDNTYRGGHGADTVLRSSEDLSKATAGLTTPHPDEDPLATVRKYQQAAEADPSESNLLDWGAELLTHRAPQAAAQVFNKAMQRYPQSTRVTLGLAASYYAAGSYDEAQKYFYQATDLNPVDPAPYLFLSKVQAQQITASPGYQERMDRFRKVHPENALANYYDALSLWQRNRIADAKILIDKAIAIDPRLGPAYLQLGIMMAAEQKYPQAVDAYQRAIKIDPNLAEAHYRLSEVYRVSGDPLKAKEELATYKELSQTTAEKLEKERRELQQFVISMKK